MIEFGAFLKRCATERLFFLENAIKTYPATSTKLPTVKLDLQCLPLETGICPQAESPGVP